MNLKPCYNCGQTHVRYERPGFRDPRIDRLFCSNACRQAAYRRRKRENLDKLKHLLANYTPRNKRQP